MSFQFPNFEGKAIIHTKIAGLERYILVNSIGKLIIEDGQVCNNKPQIIEPEADNNGVYYIYIDPDHISEELGIVPKKSEKRISYELSESGV